MKILYCVSRLYNSAGIERIISEKANYLCEHGYSVTIVTADQYGKIPYYPLNPKIKCIDLGINYSETTNFIKKLIKYPYKRIKHQKRLKDILFSIRPDIVITTIGNEFLFLHKIKDGSKKIAEIHFTKDYRKLANNKFIWKIRDNFRSCQEERKLKKYDRFIVLTHEDKLNWIGFNNIEVIPNFIKIPQKKKKNIIYNRFLCVGRLNYQKGYDLLIKACYLIKDELKGWKIDIFGGGELKDELLNSIRNCGLQEIINLYPPKPNIDEEYLTSDALILSSRYEGLPMVLLEASAFGTMPIAFSCPCGPRDIITDGVNGILVENGNIEFLAENLKRIISGEVNILQLNSNAEINAHRFNIETIMEKWITLFNGLTKIDEQK